MPGACLLPRLWQKTAPPRAERGAGHSLEILESLMRCIAPQISVYCRSSCRSAESAHVLMCGQPAPMGRYAPEHTTRLARKTRERHYCRRWCNACYIHLTISQPDAKHFRDRVSVMIVHTLPVCFCCCQTDGLSEINPYAPAAVGARQIIPLTRPRAGENFVGARRRRTPTGQRSPAQERISQNHTIARQSIALPYPWRFCVGRATSIARANAILWQQRYQLPPAACNRR